jgi:hypothetical protein
LWYAARPALSHAGQRVTIEVSVLVERAGSSSNGLLVDPDQPFDAVEACEVASGRQDKAALGGNKLAGALALPRPV